MTDDEYEATQARLVALRERWLEPLGLYQWDISWSYVRESAKFLVDNEADPDVVMCCNSRWSYMHAGIGFNMPLCAESDDEALELQFVHELSHVLVNELRWREGEDKDGYRMEHEEHVCSVLARAFISTRAIGAMGEHDLH